MRLKHTVYICLGILFMFFVFSCEDDKNENIIIEPSKDAQIYTFSVKATHHKGGDPQQRAKDSVGFLKLSATRFVIDQLNGVIYNPDSLPYGLEPKKVHMTTTFNSSSGISKFMIHYPDSLKPVEWNRTDSVEFSDLPLYFEITAPYGNIKEYKLDLRIHQTEPDIIVWEQLDPASAYLWADGEQKFLSLNDVFYGYFVSGTSSSLYTAEKANTLNWEERTADLPADLVAGSITVKNAVFYAINRDGKSFVSDDGINWREQNNGYNIVAIYGVVPALLGANDELLVAYREEDGTLYFATTKDLADVVPVTAITTYPHDASVNAGFPVRGFSSVTNYNRIGRYNTLILTAGINNSGSELNATWLVRKTADRTLEITSSMKNPFFRGETSSVFFYDGYLYVLSEGKMYRSKSWGEIWAPVPEEQALVSAFVPRKRQNVITDEKNYIWIFGGISDKDTYLKDVWRGRLNRLSVN